MTAYVEQHATNSTVKVSPVGVREMMDNGSSGDNISEAQQHVFALLRLVNYNEFDGTKVVEDLLRWRRLWTSVMSDWLSYSTGTRFEPVCDLRRLWFLSANEWMVDTVHILTSGADDALLRRLIEEHWEGAALHVLSADEIEWNLNTGATLSENRHVYRIWWD